jgi:hypothetical protein
MGQVGLSRKLLIATMQVEAKTTKLLAGEREVFIQRTHDEVAKLHRLQTAWKMLQEQQQKQKAAIGNLATYLVNLKEEVRLLRVRNDQGEVAYQLEKAMALARAANHGATAQEIADVRALIEERAQLLAQSKQIATNEKETRKQLAKELQTPRTFAQGWEEQLKQMRDHSANIGRLGETAARDLYQSFDTLFFDAMDAGFKNLEEVFKAFINNVLRALMSMAASEMARYMMIGVTKGVSALGGGLGGVSPGGRSPSQHLDYMSGYTGAAKGGAFENGSFVKLQKGGAIVDRPTMAPMPHDRNAILGETRPEGVFPLVRDSSGDLAIKAQGAGQTVIQEHNEFTYAPRFDNVTDGPGVRRALDGDKTAMHSEFQRMLTQNRAVNRRIRNMPRGGA